MHDATTNVNPGDGPSIRLEAYTDAWPADDPDAGFRELVAEYSRFNPLPTIETLGRNKNIPVGALVSYILYRFGSSGSEALMEIGPRVVSQMGEIVQEAEMRGTDEARLEAFRSLSAIVSWLKVPLEDSSWRAGPAERGTNDRT